MSKRKTIQDTLFTSYSILIVVIIVIFVFFFYRYTSNVLVERASSSISKLSYSISKQLDLEIRKMDTVSMNIAYSTLVEEYFQNYMSKDMENQILKYHDSKALMDIFIAISGPLQTVRQVNIYNFQDSMIGAGYMNKAISMDLKDEVWYERVIKENGKKYISAPYNDAFFLSERKKNRYFISLYRVYFNNINEKLGVIETAQDYQTIFNEIGEIIQPQSNNVKVYVFNNEGEIVYPINSVQEDVAFHYTKLVEKDDELRNSSVTSINPFTKEKEIIAHTYSDYTGWSVFIVQPKKEILLSLRQFTRLTVLISMTLLIFALVLSFLIAKRISNPIKKMHRLIKRTELDTLGLGEIYQLNSSINELEELNHAFYTMNVNLKNSMNDLLITKQQEMKARILALQSQMNSHFLYNSLANISVMAEEKSWDPIIVMCKNISYMLRYISSGESSIVSIKTELDYAYKYLECLQLRYGEKIGFSIDIDEKMKDIKIPKLLIQPLIENAVKYSTEMEPPWSIKVIGHTNIDSWQITVYDNGPGFSDEKLEELRASIEEINKTNEYPDLKIEGMGILNVFIRIKLTYKEHMVFRIDNHPNGGAMVIIGGNIIKEDVRGDSNVE